MKVCIVPILVNAELALLIYGCILNAFQYQEWLEGKTFSEKKSGIKKRRKCILEMCCSQVDSDTSDSDQVGEVGYQKSHLKRYTWQGQTQETQAMQN